MIKVAICGASGYTGCELVRLLSAHPLVQITAVTSERSAGKAVTELYPHLQRDDLVFEPLVKEKLLQKADIFFTALPHGASQETVDYFFSKGKKVVDLSADYRLRDRISYEKWYKTPHEFPETLEQAVYGLPELHREEIKGASLVANPGCYPTGAILGLYPLMKDGLALKGSIIIDSKSGASGAGRKADPELSFSAVNESFRAYAVGTHRHTPEIEQELTHALGSSVMVDFTPHLVPIDRGILSTIYLKTGKRLNLKDLHSIYRETYAREPFVRVLGPGRHPDVKNVRGTNFCDIGLFKNPRIGSVIVVTAIDNLVKGASGQAVQNMNLMAGLDETTALKNTAIYP